MRTGIYLLCLLLGCNRSESANVAQNGGTGFTQTDPNINVNATMVTSVNGVGVRVRSHLLNANMESINGETRLVVTHDEPVTDAICRHDLASVEAEGLDGRPCPLRARVLNPTTCSLEVSPPEPH